MTMQDLNQQHASEMRMLQGSELPNGNGTCQMNSSGQVPRPGVVLMHNLTAMGKGPAIESLSSEEDPHNQYLTPRSHATNHTNNNGSDTNYALLSTPQRLKWSARPPHVGELLDAGRPPAVVQARRQAVVRQGRACGAG